MLEYINEDIELSKELLKERVNAFKEGCAKRGEEGKLQKIGPVFETKPIRNTETRNLRPVYTFSQKLIPNSPDTNNNYFGRSLSLFKHQLVVGAWGDSNEANKSGCVYFYSLLSKNAPAPRLSEDIELVSGPSALSSNSPFEFKLIGKSFHPTDMADAYFGFSVAIHTTIALVGCHGDSTKGEKAGAVFVFRKSEIIIISLSLAFFIPLDIQFL